MVDITIIVRNYRCFGDEPVEFRITDGFTALVGVNGSGKTSLLRLLHEIRPLLNILATNQSNWGRHLLNGQLQQNIWAPKLNSGERAFRAGTDKPIELTFIVGDGPKGMFGAAGGPFAVTIRTDQENRTTSELRRHDGSLLGDPSNNPNLADDVCAAFETAILTLSSAMYIGPFRNAINIGGQENYYDITTGDAFVKNFADFKSGVDPRKNEAVFQLVEELRRIFDFRSLDINAATDNKTLQLTVDGRSFRLSEQGAGLAHFIVVLVNVLVSKPPFLLIDEPELNLHASLQLDFLSTLAKYTQNGVVFATHSLGLARTAADRIYTLTKPVDGTSRLRSYESEKELVTLVGQLAFNKRPEMGFNRVLLVEGRTELLALGRLLRLYGKEHEVLMIPLHGDDLINGEVRQELCDLLRICDNVQYLIDSERSSEGEELRKNRKGFVELCKELNVPGHVLVRRALENYFTDRALRIAFGDNVSALSPYGKKASKQGWAKTQNWKAAAEMTLDELNGTDLGEFLEKL